MTGYYGRQSGFGPLGAILAREEGPQVLQRLARQSGVKVRPDLPRQPLAFEGMSEMFERSARATGDALFGLRVGAQMRPEDFGPFVNFSYNTSSFGDSIARVSLFSRLQSNVLKVRLTQVDADHVSWAIDYAPGVGRVHQHALHVVPSLAAALRRLAGADYGQARLEIASTARADLNAAEAILGVPTLSVEGRYGIRFPRTWLDRPMPQLPLSQVVTMGDLRRHYGAPLPRSVEDAVRITVRGLIGEGRVDIDTVAGLLGYGRRKLQSTLNSEGATFRELLVHERMRRAMALMRAGDHPLVEIALAVGYSDQAHFNRAFVSLTGLTPGQWRALARRRMN